MAAQVGYSVVGRSRGRVASCAVYAWHVETRSVGFLVEPQNQGRRFVSGLASKSLGRFLAVWPQNRLRWFLQVWPQNQWRRFSSVWPQNWWRQFLPVWPQNRWSVSWLSLKTKVVEGFPVWASKPTATSLVIWAAKSPRWFLSLGIKTDSYGFGDLGRKITATVSWFGPQNQAVFGLSVAPQNQQREVDVGHASRSSGLLHVEASLVRVSQSGLKTDGGATAGGARGTIAKVASKAS
jgi:hypothetical protein